jgi:hypothetical protein
MPIAEARLESLRSHVRRPYKVPRLECIFWTTRNDFPLTTFAALLTKSAVVTSEAEQYRRLARELHFMARSLPPESTAPHY